MNLVEHNREDILGKVVILREMRCPPPSAGNWTNGDLRKGVGGKVGRG